MKKEINTLLAEIKIAVESESPLVQERAGLALGQYIEILNPEILEEQETILVIIDYVIIINNLLDDKKEQCITEIRVIRIGVFSRIVKRRRKHIKIFNGNNIWAVIGASKNS